ncbi:hypothetical protein E2P81_ATG07327 [Venturia nashicola]|uniref:Uncharacterized protein n=1 Tax=Venturia nashicola TaxID=86259 RepID=A0A4Z1P6N5_9PEZI|nr:hypothetical protein E6O75_ATG07485 [Venturia nashicola]TLD31837.1 hypothetical protein E2P81_ATG07327 [Venturia nashicola]
MNKAWSKTGQELKWGAVDLVTGEVSDNVFVTFSWESTKKDARKVFAEVYSSFKHHEQADTQVLYGKGIVDFWQKGVVRASDV